jgi:hypothetical protein
LPQETDGKLKLAVFSTAVLGPAVLTGVAVCVVVWVVVIASVAWSVMTKRGIADRRG